MMLELRVIKWNGSVKGLLKRYLTLPRGEGVID